MSNPNNKNQPPKMSPEERKAFKAELMAELLEDMKGAGPVVGTKLGGGITGGKARPNNTVSVTFVKRMKRGYFPGDRAGFPKAYADKLVARGIAKLTPEGVKEKALAKRAEKAAGDPRPE